MASARLRKSPFSTPIQGHLENIGLGGIPRLWLPSSIGPLYELPGATVRTSCLNRLGYVCGPMSGSRPKSSHILHVLACKNIFQLEDNMPKDSGRWVSCPRVSIDKLDLEVPPQGRGRLSQRWTLGTFERVRRDRVRRSVVLAGAWHRRASRHAPWRQTSATFTWSSFAIMSFALCFLQVARAAASRAGRKY